MYSDNHMDVVPPTNVQQVPQNSGSANEVTLEIVEDLVEMVTFHKLFSREEPLSGALSGAKIDSPDVPKVRTRRARTVAIHGRNGPPGVWPAAPRQRKACTEASMMDYRRKRSFSMCDSDEDDELISLSSSTSYHASTKHQKLRDEFDEVDACAMTPSKASSWGASVPLTSMGAFSFYSRVSEVPSVKVGRDTSTVAPITTVAPTTSCSTASMMTHTTLPNATDYEMEEKKDTVAHCEQQPTNSTAHNNTSSSSTASSPKYQPRSQYHLTPQPSITTAGGMRNRPSIFKRAQSDDEVLPRRAPVAGVFSTQPQRHQRSHHSPLSPLPSSPEVLFSSTSSLPPHHEDGSGHPASTPTCNAIPSTAIDATHISANGTEMEQLQHSERYTLAAVTTTGFGAFSSYPTRPPAAPLSLSPSGRSISSSSLTYHHHHHIPPSFSSTSSSFSHSTSVSSTELTFKSDSQSSSSITSCSNSNTNANANTDRTIMTTSQALSSSSSSCSCASSASSTGEIHPTFTASASLPPSPPSSLLINNQPSITFSGSPTPLTSGLVKPVAVSPPVRRSNSNQTAAGFNQRPNHAFTTEANSMMATTTSTTSSTSTMALLTTPNTVIIGLNNVPTNTDTTKLSPPILQRTLLMTTSSNAALHKKD